MTREQRAEQERVLANGSTSDMLDFAYENPGFDFMRIQDAIFASENYNSVFYFANIFAGADVARCVAVLLSIASGFKFAEESETSIALARILIKKFPEVLSEDVLSGIEVGVAL